jgi:hypothetical protein
MGNSMDNRFCINMFPSGRCVTMLDVISVFIASIPSSIQRGRVMSVSTLLRAVSDTERATSPPANMENTLEELPPGEQAISSSPKK